MFINLNGKVKYIFLFFSFFSLTVSYIGFGLGYIRYCAAIFGCLVFVHDFRNRKMNFHCYETVYVIILAMSVFSLFYNDYLYSFSETIVYLLIFLSFFGFNRIRVDLNKVFLLYIFNVLLWMILKAYFEGLEFEVSLGKVESPFEFGMLSYSFAIFFIAFFVLNNHDGNHKVQIVISFLGCVLTSKRAVILILLLMFSLYVFERYCRFGKGFIPKVMVLAVVLWLGLTVFISSEEFNYLTFEYFGQSANYITQGRSRLYLYTLELFNDGIGSGVSSASHFLSGELDSEVYSQDGKIIPHNEMLKFLVELGLLPFSCILFLIYKYAKDRSKAVQYLIFLSVLFSFLDNLYLYVYFWIVLIIAINTLSCYLEKCVDENFVSS